ncbi:TPA: hypothetical protein ACF2VD_004810, partial [Escherichia coli]
MKNVNILTTDIAAINALSGVELTDFLTAGYQVNWSGEREVSLVGFPCLASNKQPVEVGPGIFINRVGTVAKLAMRQPFVLFKGLTFQKLCLPGAF